MKIENINNEQDYQNALKEIERLWETARPHTSEGQEFQRLAMLVDKYERQSGSSKSYDFGLERLGLKN